MHFFIVEFGDEVELLSDVAGVALLFDVIERVGANDAEVDALEEQDVGDALDRPPPDDRQQPQIVAIIEHGRIIDIDAPQNLINYHCPERTVILATGHANAAERFRAIPGVVEVLGSDLQITIRGRGDLVANVIHCLSENHIRVTDFRTVLPNLEDVFLKVTGHSIRD